MDTETASQEIVKLSRRLAEIEKEKAALPKDAFSERANLLDEEHHLHARPGELQDSFSHTDQKVTQEVRSIDPVHIHSNPSSSPTRANPEKLLRA